MTALERAALVHDGVYDLIHGQDFVLDRRTRITQDAFLEVLRA